MTSKCHITKGRDSLLVCLCSNWCFKIPTTNQEAIIQQKSSQLGIAPPVYYNGKKFCIMKRIIGRTLNDCYQWELDRIIPDLKDILIKLDTNNIFHNDLHLKNIMLDQNYKLWIIDFGDALITNEKDIYNISKYQICHSAKCYGRKINF